MRVTVFWNKGRRDGRQAARRFFALSKSGGLTKSTSPIGQLKAASHDILQTGQTQIIAPHNPVVIREQSLCCDDHQEPQWQKHVIVKKSRL
jgi:hypothetical protein